MARITKHEAQAPLEVKIGGESKFMCMCGITGNRPFCDGSHKRTKDEDVQKTYVYDKEKRVEVQ